jgi:uncharacterized protein with HEPN domain
MTEPADYVDYLHDMCAAAQKAREFCAHMSFDEFVADDKTAFAVVRAFEIVGEACKRVPQTVRDLEPSLAWKASAALRDKLIHDYGRVDLSIVWLAVQQDLPLLIEGLERLIQKVGDDDAGEADGT